MGKAGEINCQFNITESELVRTASIAYTFQKILYEKKKHEKQSVFNVNNLEFLNV